MKNLRRLFCVKEDLVTILTEEIISVLAELRGEIPDSYEHFNAYAIGHEFDRIQWRSYYTRFETKYKMIKQQERDKNFYIEYYAKKQSKN